MQGQGLIIVIDALGLELEALKREVLRLQAELRQQNSSRDPEGGQSRKSEQQSHSPL